MSSNSEIFSIFSSDDFDYEQSLVKSVGSPLRDNGERVAGYKGIVFEMEKCLIEICVNDQTDEITCQLIKDKSLVDLTLFQEVSMLSHFNGRRLSWMWRAVNWRGYEDALMFSFSEYVPDAIILASASSLEIFYITDRIDK